MFIFSSILVAATWFISRLAWDAARPAWRAREDRRRRRFAVITATGAIVAAAGFGGIIGALYGATPGLIAAACLVPVYVFIAVVLAMLLSAFDVEA
ncbi:MAG: hypothetical protein JWM86_400 [Thermoleophilia bacterium]|nr:hypothetical protein [Thermoleophilia bacterium]